MLFRCKSTLAGTLGAAVLVICGLSGAGQAQSVQRIAAIVNDDVISTYDLQSRMRLVLFSTRLSDTAEVRQRIQPQVLRSLIDERLQLQEARRQNISVSQRDIRRAIEKIEQQNNIPDGKLDQFLSSNDVPREAMLDQIRASIAWSKLLGRRLRPRITVGEDEIDEELERIKSRHGQTEYRLGEITLAVDSPEEEANVRRTAERIVDQIAKGARFSAIARQFSQSPTAAVGGDLGWIHQSDLDSTLKEVVPKMAPGALTSPIKTVSGYRIILLQSIRKVGQEGSSDITLELHQALLPAPRDADDAARDSLVDLARTVQDSASGCSDFDRLAKELNSPVPPSLGTFKLQSLAPMVRGAVANLDVGKISDPVTVPNGVLMLMVCSRTGEEAKLKLPERDEIADQIVRDRLSLMARRYLRDIRLSAVVDIRV